MSLRGTSSNASFATLIVRAALLAAVVAPARASVIVVDWDGPANFKLLQPAIDAAAEGDTILVRAPGIVDDFGAVVDGKSLTIVGDVPVGSTTKLDGVSLEVRNLAAGQQVVVRNFRFVLPASGYNPGLRLYADSGSVWIENCESEGRPGDSSADWGCGTFAVDFPGEPGLDAQNCDAVTVVNCVVRGGPGTNAYSNWPFHSAGMATDGGPAIRAEATQLAVFESTLTGGKGGAGHLCDELADGGTGVVEIDSMIFLSGCAVQGGTQGAGPPAGLPGNGLHGDATSSCELLDTTVAPAPGGIALDIAPGAVSTYPGLARVFSLPSPMREGQSGTLTIQGVQGDFVGFFWAFDSGLLPMPKRNGWFLLNSSFVAGPFLVGIITDPAGTWSLPITPPNLLPGLQGQTFLLQAYFQHAGGGVTLSSGTAFTLLDAAF